MSETNYFEADETDQGGEDYDETEVTTEGIVPLGHDRGIYYYLSRATGQVEAIPGDRHSHQMLTHLASEVYYWQRTRFFGKKGVNWTSAADDMRTTCRTIGIFDPTRLRGRGAWLDEGRAVLHLGDKLLVDGAPSPLMLPGSRHVYEQARRLSVEIGDPLSSAEAKRLMDLCVACPWEAPDHMGRLLAGWCVIAPVCGAMPWRPHLWITSEAGGGKSWVLDNIVKPAVGEVALHVQSKTTEAGIRQTLGSDARPVIFDEAETQNERDRERLQLVLDLARQASSEEGAAIIKGSSSGRAISYRIRSCFAFSSINVGLSQAADESRTVVLTLRPDPDELRRVVDFAALRKMHADIMIPGFAARIVSRTLSLLPIIRANAEIFADALSGSGLSRRTSDTYGVLLAGAWSLRSTALATAEQADTFIETSEWVQAAVVKGDEDPEWRRAIETLMHHRLRIVSHNGRAEEVPVGELIDVVTGFWSQETVINPTDAATALNRCGIKTGSIGGMGSVVFIANRAAVCSEAFAKTPWAVSWLATMARATGARRNAANLRISGTQTKVLALPLAAMQG